MAEELKIFIDDAQKAEEQIVSKGAKFVEEVFVVDIYFNQPEGQVLKLTENNRGNFLTMLKAQNGGFQILKQEKIDNTSKIKHQLTQQFGIKCILKKKRRFFSFPGCDNININIFEDIGSFLIVEGEKVTKDFIEQTLGFRHPQYLTISFAELKIQNRELV